MGLLRKKAKIEREELLHARPVRNTRLQWERDGDYVTLIVPRRDVWWVRVLAKVFYVPKQKTIVLDEIGSWVWNLCDGKSTVEQVVHKVERRYKLESKEAEISTLTYLKQLAEKGIVGFALALKRRP